MQIGYIKECNCPADFRHLNGQGIEVDCVKLDHYTKPDYCNPAPANGPVVPQIVAWALYDALTAVRYGQEKPVVSVTMLTRCPATLYYETHYDWVGGLLDNAHMLRGTFAHEAMLDRRKGTPGWIVEEPREIEIAPDVYLYGTPDAYIIDEYKILDIKTQQKYAIDKKLKQTVAQTRQDSWVKDNITQLNLYTAMLRNDGYRVDKAELIYLDSNWVENSKKSADFGKARIVTLDVPLSDSEPVLKWAAPIAVLLQRILDNTVDIGDIPKKRWVGWSPTTGVDYLLAKHPG